MRIWLLSGLLSIGCGTGTAPGSAVDGAPPVDAPLVPDWDVAFPGGEGDGAPPDAPVPDAPPPDASLPDAAPPDAPGPLPDLTLMAPYMSGTIQITEEFFAPGHCAVQECLTGSGMRKLIRFATSAANVGEAHLVLGQPEASSPNWEWDPCHNHWHYKNFADYKLLHHDGTVAAEGHKMSFCLLDVSQIIPGSPSQNFTCDNQGISIGWADIYSPNLDCQFIDVTDVPPGNYLLSVELNPLGLIPESDYTNNAALFEVTLP